MATVPEEARKTASMMVNVYDGRRQPIGRNVGLLVTVIDGNQKQIFRDYRPGPSVYFADVPVYDNLGDNYRVIVSADGYIQTGFVPVKVRARMLSSVYLMLVPDNGGFNFNAARWDALNAAQPAIARLLAHGASDALAARDRYEQLMEQQPQSLACFFNLAAAMRTIYLPEGTPFDYLTDVDFGRINQDRFFGWARRDLVDQVKLAAAQGTFAPAAGTLHPGATSSYKQIQFGEANVQLTFHENDTRSIDGAECILVEPDIDYYKDIGAHLLLEVLPNECTGSLTDPKIVYVLRWTAGKHAGVPEFDPPYTIEA